MSSVAKAQPGDRTASVEPDEASVSVAENSWKSSENRGESFPYMGDQDDEDVEDATEDAPPAYQFHESLTIRDFGFPTSDPRHYGKPVHHHNHQEKPHSETSSKHSSTTSDPDPSAKQSGQATALYDFDAENPSELSFREGQSLNILFRQCAGWLVGEMEVEEEEEEGGGESGAKEGKEEEEERKEVVVGGEEQEEKCTMMKVGGIGGAKRKKVVKMKKGLVPENYVEIWGS